MIIGYRFCLLVCFLTLTSDSLAVFQQNRIYIANDDHTDYMWTADETTYAKAFVEMLDFHLDLADMTSNKPSAYQNRFNCDGSYWIWNYQQQKTPAEFSRLVARIKDGTISVPLNSLVSTYGGQPVEAVLRGMYYAGRLERKHNLQFPLAVAMENQTLPLGLASLFAGSGAKYSWRGVCACATRTDTQSFERRDHEIYYWMGHDGQKLLLKWYSIVPPGNQQIGGYAESFNPVAAINFLDSDPAFLKRYRAPGMSEPFKVRGAFGFGWDALDRKTGQPYTKDPDAYPLVDHFHRIAEEQTTESRQVIVSNERDFFEDFQREHGSVLNSQSLTYGNEWDLYSASMSETSARVKRAVERLRTAELLAVYASRIDPEFMQSFGPMREQAFMALGLYWEHNWTADGPISRQQRAAWQEKIAAQFEQYVEAIYAAGSTRLMNSIAAPENVNRFFVFNALGWSRTQHADFPYSGETAIEVIDCASNQAVPHQIIRTDDLQQLRILASDVPAAGYKVFEVRSGHHVETVNVAAKASLNKNGNATIENEMIRIVVDRDGAIGSLVDKRNNAAELAATINGLKINDIAENSDDGTSFQIENEGPVSVSIRATSLAALKHETTLTLFRDSPRVDIHNEIQQNFNDVRTWAFSFNLNDPTVHTEEVGSVNVNKLQSDGGDYANTHARYDYLTVNHFADFTNGAGTKGVTLSNPDLAFGTLGNSTPSTLDSKTPQLRMLAGGQVDGPKLGIPAQNGCSRFIQRFALRPHDAYDQVAAMKFSLEHQNPFVTGVIKGNSAGVYPEREYSLLTVQHPDVLLWALKPADDGVNQGVIARLWNLSDDLVSTEISVGSGASDVQRVTHIETDIEPVESTSANEFPATFTRQQLQTYRFQLGVMKNRQ